MIRQARRLSGSTRWYCTSRPFRTSLDEAGPAQDREVLGHVRLAHAHVFRQPPDLARALVRKAIDDFESPRVGQRLEDLGLQREDLIHREHYEVMRTHACSALRSRRAGAGRHQT